MAAVVGMAGLTDADRRAAEFSERFESDLVSQRERRTIGETIEIGWRLLEAMPREELSRIAQTTWATREAAARTNDGETR